MKHKVSKILSAIFFLLFCVSIAQAQTPQATLTQYIADLQKNPGDYALREKIIRHVQTMKQKPPLPEEAERYMARGAAAVKGAKTEKDFQEAAAEFEKASLAARRLLQPRDHSGQGRQIQGSHPKSETLPSCRPGCLRCQSSQEPHL